MGSVISKLFVLLLSYLILLYLIKVNYFKILN